MRADEGSSHRTTRFHERLLKLGLGIVVLVTLLRVWVAPVAWDQPASAQIPDAGLQRNQLLEETRKTNQMLSDIKRILEKGTLNVRLQGADNQADPAAPGS